MFWRAGDPWAPLNCQDPLFRLTSLHPRQTGGSIGGVLPLCRTAAGEFYPPPRPAGSERKPEKMWVDKGKEFYNKDVKDLIELYSTENEEKSSVVERWIRTMKEKMWKYFSANSTNNFINVLSDLVKEYNNARHSSIKMTPVKASKKENKLTVWRNLYPEHLEIHDIKPKFPVGLK